MVSSSDYAVDLRNLGKRFRRQGTSGRGSYSTLKEALLSLVRRRQTLPVRETIAVEDLTIRIPRGASVGVIGRNGSGKSTLLKLITGIYRPDQGTVAVHGRVAALIELGAGFHPDFTGRENLFLSAAMYGLSRKEIEGRFDAIVDFAELRAVIDEPVRTYSSGMFMRLGFSIALHTEPDVLLIDEVLSVGDAGFVAKCHDALSRLRARGTTLFIVSHDLEGIARWCDEVLWLHQGVVKDRGEPRRVIDAYRQFIEKGEEAEILNLERSRAEEPSATTVAERSASVGVEATGPRPERWGSREIEIEQVSVIGRDGSEHRVFHPEDPLTVVIRYRVREPQQEVVFGVGITRADGLSVFGSNTDLDQVSGAVGASHGEVRFVSPRISLLEGAYLLDVAVHRRDGYPFDYRKNEVQFSVRNSGGAVGVVSIPRRWEVR